MVRPRKSVMRFESVFCAVSERESSTPHTRMRLPNIKKPTSATLRGETMPQTAVIMIGNRIFVRLLTVCWWYGIRIIRSCFVVSARMTGGCTIGTSAMYEYAATMIAPR